MARPKKTVIKPIIKTSGHAHVFETLEEEDALPDMKAVGVVRVTPTSKDYVSFVAHIKDGKIESIEVSEPNLRAISEEEAKIEFVNRFMNTDLM